MRWKQHKVWMVLLILTILPLICSMIMCAQQGAKLNQIYLPNSNWNDELIYYKWVEGTSYYDIPQGYFGYNESHAKYLNFGTWSPILNSFWFLFGKIFGWSFTSPIYCNIFLMCIAMCLFAVWAKPDLYQALALTLLFASYASITRFMLSGLSEISCYFLLILVMGLTLKQKKEKWVIWLLFLLVYLLTLMRPYYILLFFLPGYFWFVSEKKKGVPVFVTLAVFSLGGGTYIWINNNLCAPYFSDLFHTEWLKLCFSDFGEGVFNIFYKTLNSGKIFLQYVGNGLTGDGDPSGFISQGGWCLVYFLFMIWFILRFCQAYKMKDRSAVLYAYGFILLFIMLLAVFLLFDVFNGSKHFVEFTVMGIFVMAITESLNKKTVMLGILFVYLFTAKATSVYEWSIPVWTWEMEQEIEYGKAQLADNLIVDTRADRWDNTVIWELSAKWQDAYAFPAGVGINLCQESYIIDNFYQLKSRYLMTKKRGKVNMLCKKNHAELLAEYGQVHVWKLR